MSVINLDRLPRSAARFLTAAKMAAACQLDPEDLAYRAHRVWVARDFAFCRHATPWAGGPENMVALLDALVAFRDATREQAAEDSLRARKETPIYCRVGPALEAMAGELEDLGRYWEGSRRLIKDHGGWTGGA